MIDDITNFLPKYPNINNYTENYLNPYEDDFYESIFKKKEFYEEKLDKYEPLPDEKGKLLKNQKIISRFFSSYTPYDQLLLVHEMGTGKTCSAIGAIEKIKNENSTINGALILARGKGLLNNFKNELVFKCTKDQYIPENYDYLTPEERVARTNKLVRQFYDIDNTFFKFAKLLSTYDDDYIIRTYSNKIIVIDEVHNVRIKEIEENETVYVYKELHRFLHLIKNCKILLMSGTPIKDSIDEFANILNLILPLDQQLPIKDKFIQEYFYEKDEIYRFKKSKIKDIKNKLKGRISYLKASSSTVKKIFEGESNFGSLKHFIVFPDYMSDFQSKYYEEIYKNEGGKGVYIESREASLFIFPDKTCGDKGFENNIETKSKNVIGKKNKLVKKTYYVLSENLKKLKGSNDNETLENIEKYSSKYAACIKNILNAYKNKQKSFVYCEYVKGSGAILFSLLLNLFGFSSSNDSDTSVKGKRYALLNNISSSTNEIKNIIEKFNKQENMFGEYISVIIGSKVISEGFSFLDIIEEHILTPHWNYSETDQAIARGYRFGSHKNLINSGIKPKLKIYQYVSIPDKKYECESIDLKMYEISEIKDINIKNIERVIKESAFDCALNYERNHITGYDNQRECDYTSCEYTCDGVPEYLYIKNIETEETEIEETEESEENEESDESEEIIIRKPKKIENILINELRTLGTYSEILNEYKNLKNIKDVILEKIINKNLVKDDFNIDNYNSLLKQELGKLELEEDVLSDENDEYESEKDYEERELSDYEGFLIEKSNEEEDVEDYGDYDEEENKKFKSGDNILIFTGPYQNNYGKIKSIKNNSVKVKINDEEKIVKIDDIKHIYYEDYTTKSYVKILSDNNYGIIKKVEDQIDLLILTGQNKGKIIKYNDVNDLELVNEDVYKKYISKNIDYGDDISEYDGNEDFEEDLSTYQLYYDQNDINKITDKIIKLFNEKYFKLELKTILKYFPEYTEFQVMKSLNNIINENKIIKNKYGFYSYLKENNNMYFLVDNLSIDSNYYSEYYDQYPITIIKTSFDNIINNIYQEKAPQIIKEIFETTDSEKIKKIIDILPLEIVETILENSIIAEIKNIKKNSKQREILLNIFNKTYKKIVLEDNTLYISNLLYEKKQILRCLDLNNLIWKDCTSDFIDIYKEELKKEKEKVKKNIYQDYYGVYNGDIFCIKTPSAEDVIKDKRKKKIGQVCGKGIWTRSNLTNLLVKIFKVPIPNENIPEKDLKNNRKIWLQLNKMDNNKIIDEILKNDYVQSIHSIDELKTFSENDLRRIYYWGNQQIKQMCQVLREFLDKEGLLIEDPNCGIQEKDRKDEDEEEKKKEPVEKKKRGRKKKE